jgi:hypothetical protein
LLHIISDIQPEDGNAMSTETLELEQITGLKPKSRAYNSGTLAAEACGKESDISNTTSI